MDDFELVCENLVFMENYKTKDKFDYEKTFSELFSTRNNDDAFKQLFKIGFDNCENVEKAKQLMNKYLKSLNIVTVDKIYAIIWLSNDFSICKFEENDDEKSIIIELIRKIVKERTRLVSTYGEIKTYDILPEQKFKDKFSLWNFDPLAGQMKIYVELDNKNIFPKYWTLSETAIINVETKTFRDFKPNDEGILNSNMRLIDFCEAVCHNKQIVKVLNELYINSVDNLIDLDENGWNRINDRLPAYVNKLKNSINIIEGVSKSEEIEKKDYGDLHHDWHKAKLSLYYYSKSDYKQFGYINEEALNLSFEEQMKDKTKDFGNILMDIKDKSLRVFTTPQKDTYMRLKSQGLLLYGPPGTGKTDLSKILMRRGGFQFIIEPLSSTELSRSLVGETEKLLIEIWNRAKRCPHLLCCIAIDEIDALTPKRNNKAAGHKVDALSILLSLVGGIKNIPNVFIIASTNFKNRIDEAFSRRIQDKYFIGKLTNIQRVNLIKQITSKEANLPAHVNIDFNKIADLIAKVTTNFSGAALSALRTRILTYFDLNKNNRNIRTLSKDLLIETAIKVADDFQITLGKYSIPRLLKDFNQDYSHLWTNVSKEIGNLSGRAIIDLQENGNYIGFENRKDRTLLEIKLENNVHFTNLISIILDFTKKFEIDNILLINNDLLANSGSFSEEDINETINSLIEEFDKFENGIIIFDIDNLVGINESSSSSNDSNSNYSIQKQSIWQNILNFNTKTSFISNKKLKWCFIVSYHQFLIKQFKTLTKFPKSKLEIETERKDIEEKTLKRKCINCNNYYYEAQNNIDSCSYHDGALVRIDQDPLRPLTREELHSVIDAKIYDFKSSEDIANYLKNYLYLCCKRPFHESQEVGCVRNKHSDTDPKNFDPNVLNIYNQINNDLNYYYDM